MNNVNELMFWKVKAEHTKDELFADATLLWVAADKYFTMSMENPLNIFPEQKERKVQAFTLQGVCLYLGCTADWFQKIKDDLDYDSDKLTPEQGAVLEVMNRIIDVVYQHKFIYAAAGLLRAPFISQDLRLAEKKEKKFPRFKIKIGD